MIEDVEELIIDEDDELFHYGTPQLYPGDPHGSGRYREGTGDNPNQHGCDDFLERFATLKRQGLTEKDIATAFGLSTTQLRIRKTVEMNQRRSELAARAEQLKKQGVSATEGARIMGLRGESSFRSLLNAESKARMNIAEKTAHNLAKLVDERGMIDVGEGVEKQLGISEAKFNAALKILESEGYKIYGGRVPQVTNPGKKTTIKVLCPPDTEHKDIYNYGDVHSILDITSRDDGNTFEPSFRYPESMDSSRLAIRYSEQGGAEKDGQVEIRRGVKDLYMGDGVNYAQVRILVDGTHFIKGMAIYSDDLPDGVDVMFNSNKSINKYDNKLDYLKPIEDDPDNPFGSAIKENKGQVYYDDPKGKYTDPVTGHRQSLGLINKRAEEGDWYSWKDKVPSQFLSKQPKPLIERQLKETLNEKQQEYEEIMSLTNPTIKRSLLKSFADDCDSSAVDLKATAFPNQKYQVIMPLQNIKDNEVYAPNFKDGSTVALVRFPHGGTFEIPILKVNNRNEEGIKNLTSTPKDAIGINYKVAERLSGADFDGDTVMVIPLNDKVQVKSTEQLKGLKHFDTKLEYGPDDKESYVDEYGVKHYVRAGREYRLMSETQKQKQMGIVSNLITDMTLQGAPSSEIEKAVKHSMVVIDAVKHKLDYRQSEKDNDIARLRKEYQGYLDPETGKRVGGASTLISRSTSPKDIPERKEGGYFTKDTKERVFKDAETEKYYNEKTGEIVPKSNIKLHYTNPVTGEKVYTNTGRKYYTTEYKNSKGKTVTANVLEKDGKRYFKGEDGLYKQITNEPVYEHLAMIKAPQMSITSDAYSLSRGTIPEQIYAEYANKLKSLANRSRLNAMELKDIERSVISRKAFKDEYNSLKQKLDAAIANAPKERQAQLIANSIIKAKLATMENVTEEKENKIKQQSLSRARKQVGAKRTPIEITPNEWKAIQAGAISKTMLEEIIKHVDSTTLKQLAMPRSSVTLSDAKVKRLKGMSDRGYTTNEIAQALGISTSTVVKYLKGE